MHSLATTLFCLISVDVIRSYALLFTLKVQNLTCVCVHFPLVNKQLTGRNQVHVNECQ
jgi:hypothetical protein